MFLVVLVTLSFGRNHLISLLGRVGSIIGLDLCDWADRSLGRWFAGGAGAAAVRACTGRSAGWAGAAPRNKKRLGAEPTWPV